MAASKTTKTRSRESAVMPEAHGKECFWVVHGPVVKNISELIQAVEQMSDEQYAHHTARDGNDFERWICDVLHLPMCAARVKRARTRTGTLRALKACLHE